MSTCRLQSGATFLTPSLFYDPTLFLQLLPQRLGRSVVRELALQFEHREQHLLDRLRHQRRRAGKIDSVQRSAAARRRRAPKSKRRPDLPANVDVATAGDIVPKLTGILWNPVLHVDLVLLSNAPVSITRPDCERRRTDLVSTRRNRERELALLDEVLPKLAKVEIGLDRSAAKEQQVLCTVPTRQRDNESVRQPAPYVERADACKLTTRAGSDSLFHQRS